LALRRKVELKLAEKWAVAEPASQLQIFGSIDWDHPSIGYQEFHYVEGKTDFKELAAARTFGFLRDVEMLKSMGLAQGGSLENAVVLNHALVLNPEGLRFPDEFARHKVLDALGDFKLAGIAIHAHIRLHRAGHDLHSQLLKEIFSNPDNFEIVDPAAEPEERRIPRLRAALAIAAASV
jgi:UDP-3-O-[3-hydroxymyristoyl] N-acetylglucosamine deacetylase